jgi:hypothetical protein
MSLKLSGDLDMPISYYPYKEGTTEIDYNGKPAEVGSLLDISVNRFVVMCINNHGRPGRIYIVGDYVADIIEESESILDRLRPKS